MAIKNLNAVLKLDFPVDHNGSTISELTMRRPITNDEIRKAQRIKSGLTDQEVQTQMFADMCGVEFEVLCKTDLTDQQKLVEAYEAFFPKQVKDAAASQTPQA